MREQFVSEISAGRIGEGEEAAELVLATDASDFLGGAGDPDLRRVGYLRYLAVLPGGAPGAVRYK